MMGTREEDAAAERDAYIAKILADAPPPTEDQARRIAAILGDAAMARRRRDAEQD